MSEELRKVITEQEVECGKSVVTEYFDAEGKLVRRDTNIIVDAAKLPQLGAEVKWP